MSTRIIARLYLPLDLGAVGRILKAVSRDYPDAVMDQRSPDGSWAVLADPDISIGERRRIARERQAQARAAS